jgi:hypothetical protein
MRCLYQKDERALPGNLQNKKYRFFPILNVVAYLSLLCHFSLSLSHTECMCVFGMVFTINSDYFPEQRNPVGGL